MSSDNRKQVSIWRVVSGTMQGPADSDRDDPVTVSCRWLVTPLSSLWFDVQLHVEARWMIPPWLGATDMSVYNRVHELELTASGSSSDLLWLHVTTDIYYRLQQPIQFWNTVHTGSAKHTESLNNNEQLRAEIPLSHAAILKKIQYTKLNLPPS